MFILLVFILTSYAEYLSITALMCSAFKLDFRRHIWKIIFICLSLTYVSYVMRANELALYTPITQIFLWIVYMWLLFRLPLIYSGIVTVTCTMIFAAFQGFILFITMQVTSSEVKSMTITMGLVSSISSISVFIVANLIHKRNMGFSFVSEANSVSDQHQLKHNGVMMFVIVLSLIVFFATYSLTILLGSADTFLLTVVLLLVILAALIYLSTLKEIRKYTRKRLGR